MIVIRCRCSGWMSRMVNINCGTNGNSVCVGVGVAALLGFPATQSRTGTRYYKRRCGYKRADIQRGCCGCGYFGMLIFVVNEIDVAQIGT